MEVNLQNTNGQTPFFVATMFSYVDLANRLLQLAGPTSIDTNSKDSTGVTPLIYATIKENVRVINFLIARVDVNARDKATG